MMSFSASRSEVPAGITTVSGTHLLWHLCPLRTAVAGGIIPQNADLTILCRVCEKRLGTRTQALLFLVGTGAQPTISFHNFNTSSNPPPSTSGVCFPHCGHLTRWRSICAGVPHTHGSTANGPPGRSSTQRHPRGTQSAQSDFLGISRIFPACFTKPLSTMRLPIARLAIAVAPSYHPIGMDLAATDETVVSFNIVLPLGRRVYRNPGSGSALDPGRSHDHHRGWTNRPSPTIPIAGLARFRIYRAGGRSPTALNNPAA